MEKMEEALDEIVEKTESGYNLVVTKENKQIWMDFIRDAKAAARKRYMELYPGADVDSSMTAQIWIEGFQAGYIGGCIGAFLDVDENQQMDLEGQAEKILREFEVD